MIDRIQRPPAGLHPVAQRLSVVRLEVLEHPFLELVHDGLELASATHVRVADESVFYALPEGRRGLFVGGHAPVRVPRLIGTARMADMMLTGRRYSAEGTDDAKGRMRDFLDGRGRKVTDE